MAAPAAGGQGNQADSSMGFLWVLVGLVCAGWAIWYFAHAYIVAGYLAVKSGEIYIISLFTNHLHVIQEWIKHTPSSEVTFSKVVSIANLVGEYFQYPFAIILVILALLLYTRNPVRKFRKTYDMKRLLRSECVNWPQIAPVSRVDLIKEDINKGPWAMATTPMDFCKQHNLLQEYVKAAEEGELSRQTKVVVKLDRGLANKLFSLQLGPLWSGTKNLPIHVKALYAVFAARINNDSASATKLLNQISASAATKGKLNFAGAEDLLKKYENTKLVKYLWPRHAYVLTMMASMLDMAREDGVVASADFLWLKPYDRRLWYVLNNVGRQTCFVEVSGTMAHWLAEVALGKKIITPMIEGATNALESSLEDIIYVPDEE